MKMLDNMSPESRRIVFGAVGAVVIAGAGAGALAFAGSSDAENVAAPIIPVVDMDTSVHVGEKYGYSCKTDIEFANGQYAFGLVNEHLTREQAEIYSQNLVDGPEITAVRSFCNSMHMGGQAISELFAFIVEETDQGTRKTEIDHPAAKRAPAVTPGG